MVSVWPTGRAGYFGATRPRGYRGSHYARTLVGSVRSYHRTVGCGEAIGGERRRTAGAPHRSYYHRSTRFTDPNRANASANAIRRLSPFALQETAGPSPRRVYRLPSRGSPTQTDRFPYDFPGSTRSSVESRQVREHPPAAFMAERPNRRAICSTESAASARNLLPATRSMAEVPSGIESGNGVKRI